MEYSRPGGKQARAKTVRLRSRTRSRSDDRWHHRSPSPSAIALSNSYSSAASTSSKYKRSPRQSVQKESGAERSTKRSQTTYHPRKVSQSPNAVDTYQRRRVSTSRTTLSPSSHGRRSRREDKHSSHYPSPLRGQNSSPSPEQDHSKKLRQRVTKNKSITKLAPSSPFYSSPSPPPSSCPKQQRRGVTVANVQSSRYLSPQRTCDEYESHSKSSHHDLQVFGRKRKIRESSDVAPGPAVHKITHNLEPMNKQKVEEIEVIDLVASKHKRKKKKAGKERNTSKDKHVKKKKKKKDGSKERETSVADMEKLHASEPYYKPREEPTSARNNYMKCRICLSYFKDEQELKNQHLSLHNEQTFCVKVPRDHWFFNIEDAIQHLAKMNFSKEDLKKKMRELDLVIYPKSLYGYSCSNCRQGSAGNIIDFASNGQFLSHVKEFKCAEGGRENDVRVSWCRGCHIRFATHKDLDIHIKKQSKGERCFLGNNILEEIYLRASQESSCFLNPDMKHQDFSSAIKTEAFPYHHVQSFLPHLNQLPLGVVIPSSSDNFEPIADHDNHPTTQILPQQLFSRRAPNNSLSSGAEEGFNIYSDIQNTSVNTSIESQSRVPPDKISDSVMTNKNWELEMQELIQATNENMLKPSKEIQEDYKHKQVEVRNQPKESLDVGGEEEQPGTSSRVNDILAFKPIRIFSKSNLNRTLDLTSPNVGQERSGDHQSFMITSPSSRNTDDNRGLEDEHTRNSNLIGGFEARADSGTLYDHARNKQDLNIVGRESIDQSALNYEINEPAVPEQDNEAAIISQINDEETAFSPEIIIDSAQNDNRENSVVAEKNVSSEMCSWLQCSWNSEHDAGCRRLEISKRCGAGVCKNKDLHQCLDMKQNRFVPSNIKNNRVRKNKICPKLGFYVNYALTNPDGGRPAADRNIRMIPTSCVSEAGAGAGASSGMQDPRLPLLANGVYPRKKIDTADEFLKLAHPAGRNFIFANWENQKFADLYR